MPHLSALSPHHRGRASQPATGMQQQQRSGVATPAGVQSAPTTAAVAEQPHEEHLVSALHAALRSLSDHPHDAPSASRAHAHAHTVPASAPSSSPPHPVAALHPPAPAQSHKEAGSGRPHTSLDIALASDTLVLRGAGVDVAPALLTGNVVLTLSEPTSIRQVSLVFKGKARVPAGAAGDP